MIAFKQINQRDLIICNEELLSSFLYPFFLFLMILWEAQGTEERGYNEKDDAGFVGKGETLFTSARVILSGSRKSISASLCNLCLSTDSRVLFTD